MSCHVFGLFTSHWVIEALSCCGKVLVIVVLSQCVLGLLSNSYATFIMVVLFECSVLFKSQCIWLSLACQSPLLINLNVGCSLYYLKGELSTLFIDKSIIH